MACDAQKKQRKDLSELKKELNDLKTRESELNDELESTNELPRKIEKQEEEIKTLPWQDVWNEYCKQENVMDENEWFNDLRKYEKETLSKRGN